MAEPERRRRRVRPSSSSAATPPVAPADDTPADAPTGSAATTPVTDPETPTDAAVAATGATGAGAAPVDVRPAPADRPRPPAADSADRSRAGGADGRSEAGERSRPVYPRRPGGGPPPSGNGPAGAPDDRESERGLRGLVGSGSSQVSVGAALRARDAARPTDAHFDDADRNLVIVRRNWVPREELPRNR
jgi:hypothetical protein